MRAGRLGRGRACSAIGYRPSFLTGTPPREGAEAVVERMLYVLWDCGLNIGGGAIRTVEEALALAEDDVSERTALLDLRWVSGDERLVSTLRLKFDRTHRTRNAIAAFIAAKLAERDARVDRQGTAATRSSPTSRTAREPCAICRPCAGWPSTLRQ